MCFNENNRDAKIHTIARMTVVATSNPPADFGQELDDVARYMIWSYELVDILATEAIQKVKSAKTSGNSSKHAL